MELRSRIKLFIFILMICETYQFIIIKSNGFITGDFFSILQNENNAIIGYILSILSWLLVYIIITRLKSSQEIIKVVKVGLGILSIFLINILLTVFGGVGSINSVEKSQLSILATVIPIQYLIIYIAINKKPDSKNFIYLIIIIIYLFNDLYRSLIGAFFVMGFIILMTVKKRVLIFMVMCLPLIYLISKQLLMYKLESRGYNVNIFGDYVLDQITSRIALTPTFTFALGEIDHLSLLCHSQRYSNQWLVSVMSVLPKSIFGIESLKTYNNCLIEGFLNEDVDLSTVNSPFLLNIILSGYYGLFKMMEYISLSFILIIINIKFSKIVIGEKYIIFITWILFDFFWTGNITRLTIPLWFLFVCYSYNKLRMIYNNKVQH